MREGFRRLGIVFGVVLAVVWLIGSSWMIWETSSRDYRKEKLVAEEQKLIARRQELIEKRERIIEALKNKKVPYEEYLKSVTEEPTPNVLVVIWHYKWRFLSIPVGVIVFFGLPYGLFWAVGWVFTGFKS